MKKEILVNHWYKHYNGLEYLVLFLTNEYSQYQEKYPTTVVYQGKNGKRWSRPASTWFDSMTLM